MSVNESRRDFLKKSSILLGGVAVMGMTGCSQAAPEETAEVPSHPYPCCEFDLDRVEKLGYEGYYENGCCYGVAKALLKRSALPTPTLLRKSLPTVRKATAQALCAALWAVPSV